MPTVPRLQGPTVQATAAPNVRVSTNSSLESFGGGESLNQVNNAQTKMYQEARKQAVDTQTQELYAKARQEYNDLILNPDSGLMTKKGKDAFGAPDEFHPEFDKRMDKLLEDVSDSEVKNMFQTNIRSKLKMQFDEDISKHVSTQSEKYKEEVFNTTLSVERDNAILNMNDPKRFQESIGLQKSLLAQRLNEMGMEDIADQKIKEQLGLTHAGVIEKMLASDQDIKAKEHFEAYRGEMTEKQAAEMSKALEEGSLRGESQRKSDEIFGKFAESMPDALAEARKITDPKLRDETARRVKERFADQKIADTQFNENLQVNAANIIEKGGSIDEVAKRLGKNWSNMNINDRENIISYAEKRKNGTLTTDWEAYYDLKTQASSPELKSKFLQTNLMQYRSKMADAQFKELVDVQAALRTGKSDETLDGFRTDTMIVNDALSATGIDPSPKPGKKESEQVAKFKRMVDEQIVIRQQRTGKKATNEDVQKIVDELLIKAKDPKTGLDIPFFGKVMQSEKYLFELEKGDEFEISFKDIPASEKRRIEDALRRNNKQANETAILQLYLNKIKANRGS